MRTTLRLSALSLALVVGACGREDAPTARSAASLGKVNAAPSTAVGDLATAPQRFERTRFVSGIEQFRPRSSDAPHRANRASAPHQMASSSEMRAAPDPISAMASHHPVTVATARAQAEEQSLIVAVSPGAGSAPRISGPSAEDGVIDHAGEGRRDAGQGGMIGSVIIRGGHGGSGKCDPRSDTHTTPSEIGRPDFSMPLVPTSRVFGGGRHM